jgi:hypothetical protein
MASLKQMGKCPNDTKDFLNYKEKTVFRELLFPTAWHRTGIVVGVASSHLSNGQQPLDRSPLACASVEQCGW